MSEFDVERIVGANLRERNLVAREVDDLARDRRPAGKSDGGQVLRQELGAAGDVDTGQLGTVAIGTVVCAAQIAHVVEETDDETGGRALGSELLRRLVLPLVSDDETGKGESDVQGV